MKKAITGTPELDALAAKIPAGIAKREANCAEIEARLNAELKKATEAKNRSETAAAAGDADEAYTAALEMDEHKTKAEHLRRILAAAMTAPQIPFDEYAPTLAPVIEEARAINAAYLDRIATLHRMACELYDEIAAYSARLEDTLNTFDREVDSFSHRRKTADGRLIQTNRPRTLDGIAQQAARAAAAATEHAVKKYSETTGD